ncbi:MAG: metallophosphoesterase family protein [bacterium]
MKKSKVKILFFSDTHLGFDYPLRNINERVSRGEDFFRNFQYILEFAVNQKVNCLIHGGDLFYRSKIPPVIVNRVYKRLIEFSKYRIPLFIVPGNHERSNLPPSIFFENPYLNIFSSLKTFHIHLNENLNTPDIALTGFPYQKNIRSNFSNLMMEMKSSLLKSQLNLLCMHHIVEGATIGPKNYTFRKGKEVIKINDLPRNFQAILCGHIHRRQVLWKKNSPENIPVIFSGSTERTSFAEKNEPKGFYLIEFSKRVKWEFDSFNFKVLKTRPMEVIDINPSNVNLNNLNQLIIEKCKTFSPSSLVKIKITNPEMHKSINLRKIKSALPKSMIINIQYPYSLLRPHHQD